MRTAARLAVVVVAAFALFAIPAVMSRLDASPAPSGPVPAPAPYGYPSEVRR